MRLGVGDLRVRDRERERDCERGEIERRGDAEWAEAGVLERERPRDSLRARRGGDGERDGMVELVVAAGTEAFTGSSCAGECCRNVEVECGLGRVVGELPLN